MLHRRSAAALAALLAACATSQRASAPAAPAPESPAVTAAPPAPPPAPHTPAPVPDGPPPAPTLPGDPELAAALRIEADSLADQRILELLAQRDEPAEAEAPAPEGGDASLLAGSGVTWDIDVATFNSHDRVRYWVNFFRTTARERFAIWLGRMQHYEPMIRARLKQEGVPTDLVYLALIESGFSNVAVSSARAVGMWQFMPGTARIYGLRVDGWLDERRDAVKATDAAARHLADLHRQFNSYFLAAAAYNAGGGRISRSLNRLGDAVEDADGDGEEDEGPSDHTFFRLYDTRLLAQETRDYVPKLIAAALIAKQPERFGFTVPQLPAPDAGEEIEIPSLTGLDVVARLAGTTTARIREMNPQYVRLVTPPGGPWKVRVPEGRGEATLAAVRELSPGERMSYRVHVVGRRSETLSRVASRYGVSLATLAEANPDLRGKLKRGTRVMVPRWAVEAPAVEARYASARGAKARVHRVARGETLSGIARRYGVSEKTLRRANALGARGMVRAGQRLRIPARVVRDEPALATRSTGKARPGRTNAPREAALPGEADDGLPALAMAAPSGKRVAAKGKGGKAAASTSKAGKAARGVGRTHMVRRGETLTGLARRYGTTTEAIRDLNGLPRNAKLRTGTAIRIPA